MVLLSIVVFFDPEVKGGVLCEFYLSPVINSFRQIYGNKLGSLKFNVSKR